MIKAFAQILIFRLLPGWIVALLISFVTIPAFQSIHSTLAESVWQTSASLAETSIVYRIAAESSINDPSLTEFTSQLVQIAQLSPYYGSSVANDIIDDYSGSRTVFGFMNNYLSGHSTITGVDVDQVLWRPSVDGYKTLIYRTGSGTFVDTVLERENTDVIVGWDSVHSGLLSPPIDPFGGLTLFLGDAPQPKQVSHERRDATLITSLTSEAELMLKEQWAIDTQNWALTTVYAVLVASFLVILPWLVFARYSHFALLSFVGVFANAIVFGFMLKQWNWVYPITLPLLSIALSCLWYWKLNGRNQQINLLTSELGSVSELWIGNLLDDGKPEAAFRFLKEQESTIPNQKLWLMIATGFERNRQFEKAIESYSSLLNQDSNNNEAKNKIKQLREVVDGTKTMAIAQTGSELPVGQVEKLSLGRYEISKELGRGAMGIVYEAEDPKIHRKVALKVVHLKSLGIDEVDEVKLRFFREAQAAGKLNHPNIVTVYDVGEEHDVAYIAMDLLRGLPLSSEASKRPIELLKVVKWIAEAADALGYAHDNEIIHRDVKPANMIIEEKGGRLKLTDFGVARIAGVQQTQTGIVLGSPSYMSPEQIRGEKLTGKTDIFSLGVTLYQCITGELPFAGDTLPALAYSITQTKQESARSINSDVPISLVRIVNKSLQKVPEDRYDTGHDFAKALNKWVSDHMQALS